MKTLPPPIRIEAALLLDARPVPLDGQVYTNVGDQTTANPTAGAQAADVETTDTATTDTETTDTETTDTATTDTETTDTVPTAMPTATTTGITKASAASTDTATTAIEARDVLMTSDASVPLTPPSVQDHRHDGDGATGTASTTSEPATPAPVDRTERAAVEPAETAARLAANANAIIAGKSEVVDIAIATLLSGGHLLIEDIPGVGKTLLAQVLAASIGGTFRRVQGTSDLLPGDVTGSMVPAGGDDIGSAVAMRFRPGPVFANFVVFDELNRTTPRTQSALLELAEEGTVTVDGESHRLPDPFMLVATQNPIDIAGTYALGEGSLDRFAAVVTPGRASTESEIEVLTGRQGRTMLDRASAVVTLDEVVQLRRAVEQVHVADALAEYVVALLDATRSHPAIRLGASTRGGLALLGLARAKAAMTGRNYVVPDDIASMTVAALAHRVVTVDANHSIDLGRRLVQECLASVPAPTA